MAALRAGSASVLFALVRVATILLAAVFPSILHSWTTVKLRFQFPIFIDGSVFPRLWWIILNLGAGYLFRAVHGSGRVMFFCQARTDRHVFFGIISVSIVRPSLLGLCRFLFPTRRAKIKQSLHFRCAPVQLPTVSHSCVR